VFDIKPKKQLTIKDRDSEYSEKRKKRFNKVIDNNEVNFNSNIDKTFYIKGEYDEIMQQENRLEKEWKKRMLIESTPRGNIIMYFDAYKLGFAYYSDENVIPYDVLNGCAMKYVEMFRCLDFFLDERIMEDRTLPIKTIHYKEEVVAKKEDTKQFRSSNPVFAKLKPKNTETKQANDKSKEDKEESKENEPEKMMNKFISLGKIHNMSVIQTVPKTKGLGSFKSPILEKLKFSDFKKMLNMS
tara:strand:- start:4123 stop:4848 length:726 start_codon:yes stop_codon:yes gene_type:complete